MTTVLKAHGIAPVWDSKRSTLSAVSRAAFQAICTFTICDGSSRVGCGNQAPPITTSATFSATPTSRRRAATCGARPSVWLTRSREWKTPLVSHTIRTNLVRRSSLKATSQTLTA
jgi:hypothetical protein